MTPEDLIKEMSNESWNSGKERLSHSEYDQIAQKMLRIVLKAIEEGEIVTAHSQFIGAGDVWAELKPEYQKFLKGE